VSQHLATHLRSVNYMAEPQKVVLTSFHEGEMKSNSLAFTRIRSNAPQGWLCQSVIVLSGERKTHVNSTAFGPARDTPGIPPCTAVTPYQGRCLLMILHFRPVTAAVTGRTKPYQDRCITRSKLGSVIRGVNKLVNKPSDRKEA